MDVETLRAVRAFAGRIKEQVWAGAIRGVDVHHIIDCELAKLAEAAPPRPVAAQAYCCAGEIVAPSGYVYRCQLLPDHDGQCEWRDGKAALVTWNHPLALPETTEAD